MKPVDWVLVAVAAALLIADWFLITALLAR